MLSGQAYAAEAQVAAIGAQPVAAFSQTDLQALFEQDAAPMQLAALSEQEMRETEGALGLMGAVGGGLIGAISYTGYAIGSGSWKWSSFGYSVGMGALTGFSGGAAAWYVVPRVAFFSGIIAGRRGW